MLISIKHPIPPSPSCPRKRSPDKPDTTTRHRDTILPCNESPLIISHTHPDIIHPLLQHDHNHPAIHLLRKLTSVISKHSTNSPPGHESRSSLSAYSFMHGFSSMPSGRSPRADGVICIHLSSLEEAGQSQVKVPFSSRLQKRHNPVPSNQTA